MEQRHVPVRGRTARRLRTKLRFWQDYAVELRDDAYGIYNFNWGYYLESVPLLCTTGVGKLFTPGAAAP